ncbi:MAG TPA: SIMPL domain-containing protein [Gammaproteobacteria bacterium]
MVKAMGGSLGGALAIGLLAGTAFAQPGTPGDGHMMGMRGPTITVSGTGEVEADPDHAVVRLGVTGEAEEAAAAQEQVNQVMARVLQAMRRLDVPESDVRTEQLSLYPVYGNPVPGREAREPQITGYRASNVVAIALDDLGKVGDVIDAGIEAGANQLQGVSFTIRDDAKARAEALRLAVQKARAEADAVAGAMGVTIEGVNQVVVGGYSVQPPQPYVDMRRAALAESTPVQPGQVTVAASVTVTYNLREGAGPGRNR